ncbi:MAG: M1 family aminopeptidase [Pseudomonadota bacterium]|nr:M1 family aminopeptidase [Pseudomonadota bacterium]
MPLDLDALRQALEAPATLEVGGAARDAAGWTFDAGQLVLEVKHGTLVPIRVRAGGLAAPAGWVFVGEAVGRVRWPDVAAARQFAVRQVLSLGASHERLAPVAAGGDWVTAVDRAVLLQPGLGGADTLPPAASPSSESASTASASTGAASSAAASSESASTESASSEAMAALRARLAQLDDVVSIGSWLPQQALLVADGAIPADATASWFDLRTADRYGVVRDPETLGTGPEDRWLGLARDDSGAWLDRGRCRRLAAAGRDLTAGGHYRSFGEVDCAVGPAVSVTRTDVAYAARPSKDGYALEVAGDMRLVVHAERPVRSFALDVSFLRDAVDRTGVVGPIRLADGTRVDLPFRREPDRGPPDRVLVVLPATLAAGASTTLSFHVDDTWGFGFPGEFGKSTWLLWPYPRVAGGPPGLSGAATVRIGVPIDDTMAVVLPGPVRSWEADGQRWTEWSQEGGHRLLGAAIGRWESAQEPAIPQADPTQKQPAVAVRMYAEEKRSLTGVLGFSRGVIAWMNTVLPPFPVDDLTVFQAPDGWFGFTWVAPHGMVAMQQASLPYWLADKLFEGLDHVPESTLAHELAHQYWGNAVSPANPDDAWISETLAEVYADIFAGAKWGAPAYEARRDLHRKFCEQELPRYTNVSLATPGARSMALYHCGPYLFEHALRERIGIDALLGALDTFARTHAGQQVRGEDVLAAIQANTSVDLTDFWDAWVNTGYIPALAGTWRVAGDGVVSGTITADVPFVTYDVPVRIIRGGKAETVWCKVVDGQGTWTLAAGPKVERVDLDPHGMLLARKRTLRRE